MDQCVLTTMTCGCQTWSLDRQPTNKELLKEQHSKLQDKVSRSEIKKKKTQTKQNKTKQTNKQKPPKIFDIIECTLKEIWKLAEHIVRMKDNSWTKRCTVATKKKEQINGTTKQKIRQHSKEGGIDLEQENITQKTMEGIDGGLHPAVDGQSQAK